MTDLFIWAHRGASALAPENTMAAFRAAAAAGADGIELDVHLTRDGVPVVIHDDTLDRTTSGSGRVSRIPFRGLRRLDAGGWFGARFRGEPVPALAQVLEWLPGGMRLNIEIKESAAGLAVLKLISGYPAADLVVSSFNHRVLAELRRQDADLPLAFLSDSRFWRRALGRAAACGAVAFHPRQDFVTRPLVAACRQRGMAVHVWTLDDPRRLAGLQRLGVTGVFTNDPGTLLRAVGRPLGPPPSSPAAAVVE